MPTRVLLPWLAILLLAAPFAASAPAARTETKTYVAATFVPPEVDCAYDGTGPLGTPTWQGVFQQACFAILPGEGNVSLVVEDAAAPLKVRGWYVFQDATGRPMGPAPFFCGSFSAPVPPGAGTLFVVLWGFHAGCAVGAPPVGVTTAGQARATFTP